MQVTALEFFLQYSAERIEKNGAFLSLQNSLQSAVAAHQQGEAVTFLDRIVEDASWPWQIVWRDEAHFHLSETVSIHNCRIWDTENPRTFQEISLHSSKVAIWCRFKLTFILRHFFFRRSNMQTCTVTARYQNMLENFCTQNTTASMFWFSYLYERREHTTHCVLCTAVSLATFY